MIIALAVYAAVVSVLLIIAACFLVVLVQEQKAIVRRAVTSLGVEGGSVVSVRGDLSPEQAAKIRAAFHEGKR